MAIPCPFRPFPRIAWVVAASVASPRTAYADVVVYGPPGPPPPPPPGYYDPPPRRYSYYEDRGPPYALEFGVDVEGAVPLNVPQFLDRNNLEGGGGFKLRVGEEVRLRGGMRLTPEVGYGYEHLFARDDIGDAYSWDMHRFFGGVRLAFGRFLVPVVYAHVGYGWRSTGDPTVPEAGGLAFDVGGALDLRVVPRFVIGAHIEYQAIDAEPYAPEWLALGLHMNLLF